MICLGTKLLGLLSSESLTHRSLVTDRMTPLELQTGAAKVITEAATFLASMALFLSAVSVVEMTAQRARATWRKARSRERRATIVKEKVR